MGGRKKGTRAGFTAMELIITLIIIFILAAVSVPFILGALQSYRLRAAAWQIAGDLRLARQKAVSTQKRHRVTFVDSAAAKDKNTYVIEREEGTGPNPWVQDSPGRSSFSPGVNIDPTSTPSDRRITFDPKGVLSGTLGSTIRVNNSSGTFEIVTDSIGRVKVCKGACP